MAATRPSKRHRRPALYVAAAWAGIFFASMLESCQPRLLGRPQALSAATLVAPHPCFAAAKPLLAGGAAQARTGACPAAVVRAVAPLADGELEAAHEESRPSDLILWIAFVAERCVLIGTDAPFWSATLGLGILKGLMKVGSVHTAQGSMSHFALRGAIIGVVLSLLLCKPLAVLIAPNSLLVVGLGGGLEELAKFAALVWFSWSGPKFWRRKQPLTKLWPQTPRAVMLAGFSVGVGFAVAENALALKAARMLLNDDQYLLVLCKRIFTNPHPLLSGAAAGRFAERYCNRESRLSAASLWDVLWPSVTLHAAINVVQRRVQPVVWIVSIVVFVKTWRRLAVSSAQPLGGLDSNVQTPVESEKEDG